MRIAFFFHMKSNDVTYNNIRSPDIKCLLMTDAVRPNDFALKYHPEFFCLTFPGTVGSVLETETAIRYCFMTELLRCLTLVPY